MDSVNSNGKRWREDLESGTNMKRTKYEPGSESQSPAYGDDEVLDFSKSSLSSTPTPTPTPKPDVKEEEKENVSMEDAPIDLTKKLSSSPDVIMVSDSDEDSGGKVNGLNGDGPYINGEWTQEKRCLVKLFREELRNEEAKLVLLKKLRHSQRTHQLQETQNSNNANKAHSGSRPPTSAPPPLVRGSGSSNSSNHTNNMSSKQQQSQQQQQGMMARTPTNAHSQPMRQQAHQQPPPPLVMNQNMSRHGHSSSSQSRSSHSSSPNILPNYRSNMRESQSQQSQASTTAQTQIDTQTPAQRQAAAKLALRKQLEKTLLQIPPPKPPPPEMNFIPSLASNEFILLVGLEEVVKTITDLDAAAKGQKSQDVKYVFNPFTCVQCGTDFTPVWKRDKPGSKNVICETCVTSNQKKALKQEHTNRLKSAFVKALQQEQEIEQRMQSQPVTTTAPSPQPAPTTPMNLAGSSYKHSQAQLSHHNLLQAHQAQMRNNPQAAAAAAAALGIPGFSPRLAFPFPYTKPSDIQRQYLLDMIPSRNLPPGALPWGKN